MFFFLSLKFVSYINMHCVEIRLRSQLTLKEFEFYFTRMA